MIDVIGYMILFFICVPIMIVAPFFALPLWIGFGLAFWICWRVFK